MGVRIYIQCNNKKTKPFVRMGTTAHPHPRALASSSLPGLPFVSSRPGVVSTCPCLVGAGRNGWEAPNTKNVPTTAGFSRSGGKRTSRKRKTCPEGHVLRFRLAGKGWQPRVSNGGGGEWLGMGGKVSVR